MQNVKLCHLKIRYIFLALFPEVGLAHGEGLKLAVSGLLVQ